MLTVTMSEYFDIIFCYNPPSSLGNREIASKIKENKKRIILFFKMF